jgi:hypothetical protein
MLCEIRVKVTHDYFFYHYYRSPREFYEDNSASEGWHTDVSLCLYMGQGGVKSGLFYGMITDNFSFLLLLSPIGILRIATSIRHITQDGKNL